MVLIVVASQAMTSCCRLIIQQRFNLDLKEEEEEEEEEFIFRVTKQ